MLWSFLLSLFCIGLIFLFYRKKIEKRVEPDYSYIIFKDYSSNLIQRITSNDSKADKVEVEIEEVAKEEEKVENMRQEQEDTLLPTLNFED